MYFVYCYSLKCTDISSLKENNKIEFNISAVDKTTFNVDFKIIYEDEKIVLDSDKGFNQVTATFYKDLLIENLNYHSRRNDFTTDELKVFIQKQFTDNLPLIQTLIHNPSL